MFDKILVANRGEIACRIIETAHRLGMATVAVYSRADRGARHTAMAGEACAIGPPPARDSYLRHDRIIDAARRSGAQAIHPGYGFLAENAAFAAACGRAGLVFVGPSAAAIERMGAKDRAKGLMAEAGVPVVPGYHGRDQRAATLARRAGSLGYPVMIKPAAGGGGKGMRRVDRARDFAAALAAARRESRSAFGSSRVLVEKYIARPRHVEVQVFADSHGGIVHMFERECSMQRRHQKIVEEAPAPGLAPATRRRLAETAVQAARAIGYVNAGTVEFLLDVEDADGAFYFMEMNTRLQVEHPVTEAVTGLDLVEWQLRVAAGERLPRRQGDIRLAGHAIEARLYAEDPARGFLPATGRLLRLELPRREGGLRVDSGVRQGDLVTLHYDPMIAKIVAHAADREDARLTLGEALGRAAVLGVRSNLGFLRRLLRDGEFAAVRLDTGLVERRRARLVAADGKAALRLRAAAFMAAALAAGGRSGRDRHSPWWSAIGWRPGAPLVRTLPVDGVPVTFEAEWLGLAKLGLRVDGAAPVTIAGPALRDGRMSAVIDGQLVAATVAARGAAVELMLDGDRAVIDPAAAAGGAAQEGGAADLVLAPLPGRVAAVATAAGETVEKGAALVVLEAMKMEHALVAPHRGRVARVCCTVGQLVEEGAVLVELADA